MRMLMPAVIMASAIALAGCTTMPGGGVTLTVPPITLPTISPSVDATIANVQSVAVKICGFEPAAATVAQIIGTFTGAGAIVATVSGIANSICSAVTRTGARRGGSAPTVYGVAVRGRFVR